MRASLRWVVMLVVFVGCTNAENQMSDRSDRSAKRGDNSAKSESKKTASAESPTDSVAGPHAKPPTVTTKPNPLPAGDHADADSTDGEVRPDLEHSPKAEPPLRSSVPGYQAGTLTAGSFDDHANFADYESYLATASSMAHRFLPQYKLGRRVIIEVADAEGRPLGDARVVVKTGDSQTPRTLLDTTTGSDGRTLLLTQLDGAGQEAKFSLHVYAPGEALPQVKTVSLGDAPWRVQLATAHRQLPQKLDLSLVIDATGSMSDELDYLKVEIDSIVAAVKRRFPNVDQRFSLIVYRDTGDEYVVRKFDFTGSLAEFRSTLSKQQAAGGGDYPEAMHTALAAAAKLSWRDRDTARVVFLLADAPPHDADTGATLAAVQELRRKNITVFPVAASGTKDRAEYIMRATAFLTTGEYLFLTDDSGIGNPHAKPHVPGYNVDRLDNLMIRAIAKQLAGKPVPLEQMSQVEVARDVVLASTRVQANYRKSGWFSSLRSWPIRLTVLAIVVIGVFWLDARRPRVTPQGQ